LECEAWSKKTQIVLPPVKQPGNGPCRLREHAEGEMDRIVNSERQIFTAREAIDLAIQILRDRQRQASDPANASPEAKQKT